jgi:tetratricopeptide (TPR) repeat protein
LEWIFREWQMPDLNAAVMDGGDSGIASVEAHYAKLSERFGYDVRVPQRTINQIGGWLLREERIDDALRVFQANVRWHPESPTVYASVARAYEAACRWEAARESYARAAHLASANGEPAGGDLQAALDRIAGNIRDGAACGSH